MHADSHFTTTRNCSTGIQSALPILYILLVMHHILNMQQGMSRLPSKIVEDKYDFVIQATCLCTFSIYKAAVI